MDPWYRPYVVSIVIRERAARERESKLRTTVAFVAVCVGALAFVAGMAWPVP